MDLVNRQSCRVVIARLAALVPRPRTHLMRFHGLFAPHARHRRLVVPAPAPAQASDEVQRLEQHMGGAVAKGMLELVDHQGVAVAAQALQRDGGARHIAA